MSARRLSLRSLSARRLSVRSLSVRRLSARRLSLRRLSVLQYFIQISIAYTIITASCHGTYQHKDSDDHFK